MPTAQLSKLAIDCCSVDDHVCQMLGDLINADAAKSGQVDFVCLPDMANTKSTIITNMNTDPQIDLATGQSEGWHFWNGAKAFAARWMRDQGVLFECWQY